MDAQYRKLWKIYGLPYAKLVLLECLIGALVWYRRHITTYHWVGRAAMKLQLYFPERRKIVMHILGYRLILWLSLQGETET